MKQMGEMLLRRESFEEIVMGNTALVRAMEDLMQGEMLTKNMALFDSKV